MAESSSAAAAASSPPSSSRLRMKNYNNNMGEIVEVQGGHIVRSTGRKDRHSKVCTAKGPRDRRVRLSAHTAIQFYDVQDRLGYDRPSKAVDWLIKKAKAAIDQLDQLPAWNPIPTTNHSDSPPPPKPAAESEDSLTHNNTNNATTSSSAAVPPFLPPSMDSDSIADTIKSFFPIVSGEQQSNASHHHHHQHLQFHHNHHQHHNDHDHDHHHQHNSHHQSQDLRLSLQSLQDTIFHQNNDQSPLFSGTTAAAAGGWSDGSGGGGFAFNSLQDNSQLLFSTQRGPLQSSNTPSVRANNWIESQPLSSMADHHSNQISHSIIHQNQASSSFSGIGMGMGMGFSAGGGFSGGFHHFPARIRGEEEHHGGGGADKPSSASSDSRH